MRKIINISNLVITTVFIIAIGCAIVSFNNLSPYVINVLNRSNVTLVVYSAFALGLISIALNVVILNLGFSKEIIYVDQISKSASETTTQVNSENINLDFLGTMKDEFERILNGNLDHKQKFDKILSAVSEKMQAGQGIIFKVEDEDGRKKYKQYVSYAFVNESQEQLEFEEGEGLVGLAAKENKMMLVDNISEGYLSLFSGLGKASPSCVLVMPLAANDTVVGIMELALFNKPTATEKDFYNNLSGKLAELISQN